jgi:hypothetical protein
VLDQPGGAIELPEEALRHLWSEFGIMAHKGLMDVTTEGLRNDEFPEIKPMGVREVYQEYLRHCVFFLTSNYTLLSY